jgi:hypothetical protein
MLPDSGFCPPVTGAWSGSITHHLHLPGSKTGEFKTTVDASPSWLTGNPVGKLHHQAHIRGVSLDERRPDLLQVGASFHLIEPIARQND